MTQVASFTTPAETFAIGEAFEEGSSTTVELERLVPTDAAMIPFLWVWGDGVEDFQARLERQCGIGSVERLFRGESGVLLRVEWNDELSGVVRDLFALDFTLLSGVGSAEEWRLRIRFPSSEAAAEFQRYLREHHIDHRLERVRPLADVESSPNYGLTPEQREALMVAYQSGYFQEPRRATLSDVADRLGISPSAASGRLRRGHAALLERTVM